MTETHLNSIYSMPFFPLSGIRYPTGAGVGQGAGKPGKGSINCQLNSCDFNKDLF